jgi:hypothetical protein
MKPFLAGLAVAATLALSGCYESEKLLLDPKQAATPLAEGRQTTTGKDGKAETVEVFLDPDRWYRVRSEGEDERVLFVPLSGRPGAAPRYAFAEAETKSFIYGVAHRRDGQLYFALPSCGEAKARAAAVRPGAKAERPDAIAPICTFKTRSSLIAALRQYADHPADEGDLTSLAAAD